MERLSGELLGKTLYDTVGVVPTSWRSVWSSRTVLMFLGDRLLRLLLGTMAEERSGNRLTAIEDV